MWHSLCGDWSGIGIYDNAPQFAFMREVVGYGIVQAVHVLPYHQCILAPNEAKVEFGPLDMPIELTE